MQFGPFQHDVRVSAREPSMHLQKPQVWGTFPTPDALESNCTFSLNNDESVSVIH